MKSKKLISLLLSAAMIFSLAACGGEAPANTVFSADDLSGKKVGVQLGTVGDTLVTDNYSDTTVERFNKGGDAIQALKTGKVDCVVIDLQPATAFVEKNSDLKILDEKLTTEDYAICISKDKTELKDKINEALATLKENGTLEQIIANYIGDDKGTCPYESPADIDRSNGTLTMATNAQFEPYEFHDGEKIVGIDADMAQAIADLLGMELKIQDMEFDSIINAVQSGKADIGVAGMTVTEDRLLSIDFTDSYTTASQVIVVRAK